jgi:hypothetical protein
MPELQADFGAINLLFHGMYVQVRQQFVGVVTIPNGVSASEFEFDTMRTIRQSFSSIVRCRLVNVEKIRRSDRVGRIDHKIVEEEPSIIQVAFYEACSSSSSRQVSPSR